MRVAHILGDRRDHFESLKDAWELFHVIVEERKKREADPTLKMLRGVAAEATSPAAADAYTRERLGELLQFFELMTNGCDQLRKLTLTGRRVRPKRLQEEGFAFEHVDLAHTLRALTS